MKKGFLNSFLFLFIVSLNSMMVSCSMCENPDSPDVPAPPDPPVLSGFFVSPEGDDANPGTFEEPWLTWQKAFEEAKAGDTVYFRGGVYMPGKGCQYTPNYQTPVGHSGEPGKPICYFNYPGETPILDLSDCVPEGNYNNGLFMREVNYVHFKGLTVRNVFQTRDFVECIGIAASHCSNLTFENMTVHNVKGNAFRITTALGLYPEITSDTIRVINCDAYDCADERPRNPGATPGQSADGFKTWGEPGTYFVFEGCRAWNCSDDGFDPSSSTVVSINNCWSFQNGYLEGGDGAGFKTGGLFDDLGDLITRKVTNCIAAENKRYGFFLLEYPDYYRTNARFYNNFSYKNWIGFIFSRNEKYPEVLGVWRNNISLQNTEREVSNAYIPYTESHNNWNLVPGFPGYEYAFDLTDDDFLSLNVEELKAPRNPDGTLPTVNFARPSASSPAVGAGTNVGMSDAPDIGIDWDYINSNLE